MKEKITTEFTAFLLILLFVYAAFSKLFNYSEFKIQLLQSPVVKSFAGVTAWLLPAIELCVAAALTVRATRLFGFYGSLILMNAFTLYIVLMLIEEKHLPCSCGGVIRQLSWKQHIWFNLFFLALSAGGIVLERKNKFSTAINK
jgi:hypothetical protein